MRKDYLEKHRPVAYRMMVLEGALKQHLMDVNEQAHEMLEQLIEGITEQLKACNQLEWVQRMNSVKHRAEEAILENLINA